MTMSYKVFPMTAPAFAKNITSSMCKKKTGHFKFFSVIVWFHLNNQFKFRSSFKALKVFCCHFHLEDSNTIVFRTSAVAETGKNFQTS